MYLQYCRKMLRNSQAWIEFRELGREGFLNAVERSRIQRHILNSKPVKTEDAGNIEVRVLTWRRDWLNTIWSLKSFYFFSEVDFPLYIHDGGLKKYQVDLLLTHFPNAHFISSEQADRLVGERLSTLSFDQCHHYRSIGPFGRRFIDFYILSKADAVITIDADVVFFKKADHLINANPPQRINRFNQDAGYFYSTSIENLASQFGIRPLEFINAGLSLVWRESMKFELINEWLKYPLLFEEPWLTEQTIHALSSSLYGVELLPSEYALSTQAGLESSTICKHYPSRTQQLYIEGFRKLLNEHFVEGLNS
jgi:hypothetical protein